VLGYYEVGDCSEELVACIRCGDGPGGPTSSKLRWCQHAMPSIIVDISRTQDLYASLRLFQSRQKTPARLQKMFRKCPDMLFSSDEYGTEASHHAREKNIEHHARCHQFEEKVEDSI
jgi:hypothetical protein